MTVSSTPSLQDIADTYLEGNRTHKTVSQHRAAKKSLQYSALDLALEDSNPVLEKNCEVHNTLAFPYPAVAAHLNSHFPAVFALDRGLSYDVQLSVLHFQTIQQGLIVILGTHSTYLNAVAAGAVIAVLYLRKEVSVHQCFAAVEFAIVGPLVPP